MLVNGKAISKMFNSEIATWMFKFLLPPTWVLAWAVNLDNIKSTILFIVALIFGLIFGYFRIRKVMHEDKMREMDRKERMDNQRSVQKFRNIENDEYPPST